MRTPMSSSGRVLSSIVALALLGTVAAPAGAQEADLGTPAQYVAMLEPLLSPAERAAAAQLTDDAARRAFIESFWSVRDLTPGTEANEVRAIFEARARRALTQFSAEASRGVATDRGRVLLVYGLPDEQELRAIPPEAPATLTWSYNRLDPSLTVRFLADGDAYRLESEPALTGDAFLASLEEDLRVRLATSVGDRHGALAERVDPPPVLVAPDGATEEAPPPPPEVAPEVRVWMEMVFGGRMRDDLALQRRLFFFPAAEGTYTVLSFELEPDLLEFTDPAELDAVAEADELDAATADDAAEPTGDAATEGADAAGEAADAEAETGDDQAELIDPEDDLSEDLSLLLDDPEDDTPVADLRVFGGFLQGEPGAEDTMHSFIIPYRWRQDDAEAGLGPSLSVGVTLYPGTYRLAWGVLDATTGRAVTRDETVVVPDYAAGGLQLTRPVLAAAELRDDPRTMNTTTVYEGVRLGGVLVENNVGDRFARNDTVQVVVVATGWASDPSAPGKPRLEVEYRILDGLEGETSLARLASQVLDFHVLGQEIPLAQVNRLRPGRSYRIEVSVTDLVSGESAVQRVPIHLRDSEDTEPPS